VNPTTQCERVEQLLTDVVAEGRPRDAGDAVRRHLVGCERCRRYAAQLGDLMRALDEDAVPDPGEAYWEHFSGRVQQRLARARRTTWPVWAGLAAAALLVLALVWLPGIVTETQRTAEQVMEPTADPPEDLRCLLDDLLGHPDALDLSGESWDSTDWELNREEQEALLVSLRAEMRSPA
jgi:hypothetical protein